MFRWSCVMLLVLLLSGCSSNNQNVSTKDHYANDGYMGLTSSNPSLLGNPNSHNYARDANAMKRALRDIPHIQSTTIRIDGATANVHINVTKGLSDEEARWVGDQARRMLDEKSPQYYAIRVTIDQ